MKRDILVSEEHWRIIADIWSLLMMIFFTADFIFPGRYSSMAGPISAIYISILGLFASTKEYERWNGQHFTKHLGEFFVFLWTILILIFILVFLAFPANYHLSNELITVYISVLGIFALTQQSKRFYKIKK